MNLRHAHKFKNKKVWQSLSTIDINHLRSYVAYLIPAQKDDELAKRFDVVMYSLQLGILQGTSLNRGIQSVISVAEELSKKGTVPQVAAKRKVIEEVLSVEFWENANMFDFEEVRIALRDLMKYIDKRTQSNYVTRFNDFVINEEEHTSIYNTNDLRNYEKKVEFYLTSHKDDLAIFKLRNNKKITKQDLESLENVLFKELGNKSDYEKQYGTTPVTKLVRRIVGLDRKAAVEAFSDFLNNTTLNSSQFHFVKLIVDYVVKNGMIDDNRVLMEDPFKSIGSIVTLFENNIDERNRILKVIRDIKENAEDVI